MQNEPSWCRRTTAQLSSSRPTASQLQRARRACPGGPLDQVAQRPQVLCAGGDHHAGTPRGEGPAQFADCGATVGHEVQQVRREHRVKGAIADRQCCHVGSDQRRVCDPAQHAERQVTPHGVQPPLAQRSQVDAVAAAGIEHPHPRRQPGQVHHPAGDVEGRDLAPPQALPGTQVTVVGVLPRRIWRHQLTMPRGERAQRAGQITRTRSRTQILMEATSMVPRQTKSRLSYLVATARCWRSLPIARSTVLRCSYAVASKAGGRPPRRRLRAWSTAPTYPGISRRAPHGVAQVGALDTVARFWRATKPGTRPSLVQRSRDPRLSGAPRPGARCWCSRRSGRRWRGRWEAARPAATRQPGCVHAARR
jgi:hypothetical protein